MRCMSIVLLLCKSVEEITPHSLQQQKKNKCDSLVVVIFLKGNMPLQYDEVKKKEKVFVPSFNEEHEQRRR